MNRPTFPLLILIAVVIIFVAAQSGTPAHADSASDLHAELKERWYTTEIVVFRYSNPDERESLRFNGERVSAADYQTRMLEEETVEEISVLELGDSPEDMAADQRPALDVEPIDRILDYGSGEDLGSLVAQNMATWEQQLRDSEGQWLGEDQLTLTEQAARLASNRNTELLLHTAWTQAVPARDQGSPLKIEGGERYVDPRNGEQRSRLEGDVTVTLGRYLHVQPTLYYTPEYTPERAFPANSDIESATEASGSEAEYIPSTGASQAATTSQRRSDAAAPAVKELSRGSALDRLRDRSLQMADDDADRGNKRFTNFEQELPPYVRLEQSRRVRSGELHYIDHPEVGILVRVTPVAAPDLLQEQFTLLQ